MDEADQAARSMEVIEKANLSHSHKYVPEAYATGECLFCGEPVTLPRRWCNFDCMRDWERDNAV